MKVQEGLGHSQPVPSSAVLSAQFGMSLDS
jgi:hypothetical protein